MISEIGILRHGMGSLQERLLLTIASIEQEMDLLEEKIVNLEQPMLNVRTRSDGFIECQQPVRVLHHFSTEN